ncbi:MAG: hypothetical protein LBO78_00780 [Rickettsiales bacterium]|jgi:hypothetical protein|nr:hypothetical protein [Rickettsiales bacterium]
MKMPTNKSAKACILAGLLAAGLAVLLSNRTMRRMPASRQPVRIAER